MAQRIHQEGCSDIGCFVRLTNAYCIVGRGSSENFQAAFEAKLSKQMPVIHCTVGGTKLVGRLTVGNRHGLILCNSTSDQELQHIRNSLPVEIQVCRLEERLNTLGNIIACNDSVAILHPDADQETEDVISRCLKVECFRLTVCNQVLVGAQSQFTNVGGIVHPMTSVEEMNELSTLLQVPLTAGTINRGNDVVGSGVVANDFCGFVGIETTQTEIFVVDNIFKFKSYTEDENIKTGLINSMV